MDASLTSKPQTLVSSLSLHSKFHLRKEFLGCGAHVRAPGLRSQSIKRRLGLRIRSPKCLLDGDSVEENSILSVAIAALATFATLQLIYINYGRLKRIFTPKLADDKKANMIVSSELCKQDEDTLKYDGSQLLSSENLCIDPFEGEHAYERSYENICYENAQISDATNSRQLELQKVALASQETSVNEVELGCQLVHSPPDGDLLKGNPFTSMTSPAMVNEMAAEGDFAVKMPNFLSEMEEDIAVASCSTISANKESGKVNQNDCELGRVETRRNEILIVSNDRYLTQPAIEVSYCADEKQPAVESPSSVRHLSTKSSQATSLDNIVYHSHLKTALESGDTLAKGSPLTAEAQSLMGCVKEGVVSKEHELITVGGPRKDMERTLMHKSNKGDFLSLPQQNGFVRGTNGPTAFVRTYNRLLGDGRLRDCIDLLERMERKGLLDMDKVHHTKFLNACKSKKSVREAFQFCKLIPKPTLSTFNMLLSVCASTQDFDGAFQAMLLVKEAGLKPDCKLYTTLISTCAKCGKVDAMFEVFHDMVNAGVEPNANTYGAIIDGCARSGQVAKAFGAYGIMRSKKVQPDRVVFNALITACGQSGAVDRAFDVLAEMRAEPKPIDPDHVTVGALMKTCTQAGQVGRVPEVYKMLHKYNIRGTPEVYTIAVNSCSQAGDLEFALSIYTDMKKNSVVPDEMFLSTLIDVAGHAGKVDTAFEILHDARKKGIRVGNVSYSSLMGACCNAKNWQKALELYEEIKAIKLLPTVSTLNALVTSLCDGDQLNKAVEVLDDMKEAGVQPNIVTYSILIVACEKKGEAELGFTLLSKAKMDGIFPNIIMCRCLAGLCLKSLEKAYSLGDTIVTFNSGKPQIDSKWTSRAIMVYRETIAAGVIPTIEVFSQVLGCLQFPRDSSLRNRFVENLGIQIDASRCTNICSLLDGFGEYDTRCFSVLEEAVSLGVIPRVSFMDSPIVVDARRLLIHTVEVYLLTILKGLKHRLAAGARLPNISILLPVEKTHLESSNGERGTIRIAGRIGQAVGSLLRRLGLQYTGDESYGKIRINGLALRRWFKPKLSRSSVPGRPAEMVSMQERLAKGISNQQRNIRSVNNLSLE